MDNISNTSLDVARDVALDARSVALSALLGTHPPELPGYALVALADLFGIAAGTMRTALSRSVARGELALDHGRYRLGERLIARQRGQDVGRVAPGGQWDGAWHTVVALDGPRPIADRRRHRAVMSDHHMGELRPDTWMRPANLPAPELDGGWLTTTGSVTGIGPHDLVRRLWDLDAIDRTARALDAELTAVEQALLSRAGPDTIPATFVVAASVLRFLRAEPLLPPELAPHGWAAGRLRGRYAAVEAELRSRLRDFFRSSSAAAAR